VSILSRLFGKRRDDRQSVRALWHRIVGIAREPEWYANNGIADTVGGRFDAITLVLSLVLLRMEREPELAQESVWLTELFVDDMDGQLRESGIGDLVVGKHVGRLMGVLGGRLGALRDALAQEGAALAAVIARNVALADETQADRVAARAAELARQLDGFTARDLLEGEIVR